MVTLSALISDLDCELLRLGYKELTMIWYRQCWRRLEQYFSDRGIEEFSLEIAMAWVDTACDFFAKEQTGTPKQTDVYIFRVVQMLGDFVAHGAVLRRYDRRADKLTAGQTELIDKFQAGLRAGGGAISTIRTYGTLAGEFLSFVDTRGRLAECDTKTVEAFRHLVRIPGKDGRTKTVRGPLVSQIRRSPGTRQCRCIEGCPAGEVQQARQSSIGVGRRRCGQDSGSYRPG